MMDFSLNNTGITNSESKVVENILELDKKIPLLKYERDFMADTFAEDVLFITGWYNIFLFLSRHMNLCF